MDNKYDRYYVARPFQIIAYRTLYEHQWDKNHLFFGESHNFWEFICILDGEAETVRDNEVFLLRPGNFISYPPMTFHSSRSLGSACHSLNFSFEIAGTLPPILSTGIFYLSPTEINELYGIFQKLQLAFTLGEHDPDLGAEATNLMESFIIKLSKQHTPHHKLSKSRSSILYQKIVVSMQDALYENIPIQEIALRNGVSSTTIKDLFRNYAGIGPKKYYSNMRGIEALRLLEEGIEIEQIAEKMNYSSTSYFSNTFKKQFGLPPGQFRKMQSKNDT